MLRKAISLVVLCVMMLSFVVMSATAEAMPVVSKNINDDLIIFNDITMYDNLASIGNKLKKLGFVKDNDVNSMIFYDAVFNAPKEMKPVKNIKFKHYGRSDIRKIIIDFYKGEDNYTQIVNVLDSSYGDRSYAPKIERNEPHYIAKIGESYSWKARNAIINLYPEEPEMYLSKVSKGLSDYFIRIDYNGEPEIRTPLPAHESNNMDSESKEDNKIYDNAEPKNPWSKKYFVDKFGDATDQKYIQCIINSGTFSNTATQNSPLIVRLSATVNRLGELEFHIYLHEYARNKSSHLGESSWTIYIKDASNNESSLSAKSYSDRIYFWGKDAERLDRVLRRGGKIKFVIDQHKGHSEYSFTIQNASSYDATFNEWLGEYIVSSD